jgi:hypothetical protein
MRLAQATLIWAALVSAICVPIAAAAASPLLEWRGSVYILGGFAGIIALGLLLIQPLLIGGYLPGPSAFVGGVHISGSEACWSWRWWSTSGAFGSPVRRT